MTYSCLNSTLQFVGALYVTIVFDSILFRRFGAPNYYTILQKHIKTFNLPVTIKLNDWMTNQIKEKNHIFQGNSRKRGAIFLTTTLIMLISIGILDNLDRILTYMGVTSGFIFDFSNHAKIFTPMGLVNICTFF